MSSIILGEPIERMEVNEFLLEVTADDIQTTGVTLIRRSIATLVKPAGSK